jgi:acetyl-CoA synthetase
MGKPLPGIEAAVVKVTKQKEGQERKVRDITSTGGTGELALKKGWPSMFRGYLDEEERYRKCFSGDWYLTGDLASCDEDGYFWFVGRADDIIKTAGHMVGPFEVESALMEHPAVAEAAVIGKPDPMMGEMVKAFVVLKDNSSADEEFVLNLKGFARKKLGPAVAPKEFEFVEELPKTRSGKIMRRLLRDEELERIQQEKK